MGLVSMQVREGSGRVHNSGDQDVAALHVCVSRAPTLRTQPPPSETCSPAEDCNGPLGPPLEFWTWLKSKKNSDTRTAQSLISPGKKAALCASGRQAQRLPLLSVQTPHHHTAPARGDTRRKGLLHATTTTISSCVGWVGRLGSARTRSSSGASTHAAQQGSAGGSGCRPCFARETARGAGRSTQQHVCYPCIHSLSRTRTPSPQAPTPQRPPPRQPRTARLLDCSLGLNSLGLSHGGGAGEAGEGWSGGGVKPAHACACVPPASLGCWETAGRTSTLHRERTCLRPRTRYPMRTVHHATANASATCLAPVARLTISRRVVVRTPPLPVPPAAGAGEQGRS